MILSLLAASAVDGSPLRPQICAVTDTCKVTLNAAQVFDLAARLAADGHIDQAIGVLKVATADNNPDYRAEARARIARLLIAKGDRAEALYWYRQLLDERPAAAAVRLEVARLLASMGKEDAAQDELRRAEAAGLPVATQRFVHRVQSALRGTAPVTADLSIGIAPDTNISSQTSADSFTIFNLPFKLSNDARAHSGIGLTFAGQVTLRQPSDTHARLISHVTTIGSLYRDKRYNDVSFLGDTGPEFGAGRVRIRPALTVGERIYGVDRLYDLIGPSLAIQWSAGQRSMLTLNASAIDYSYTSQRASQSGMVYTYGAAFDRALTPSLAIRSSVSYARTGAADASYASRNYTADLALSQDFGRLTIYAHGAFTKVRGDADFLIFGVKRDDRIYEGDGAVQFRHVHFLGMSPQVKVTYLRSDSSVPLYQYRRLRGELGLTSLF